MFDLPRYTRSLRFAIYLVCVITFVVAIGLFCIGQDGWAWEFFTFGAGVGLGFLIVYLDLRAAVREEDVDF